MRILLKTAKRIGHRIGVDWDRIDIKEFRQGMQEELEHSSIPKGDLEMTGKIALDHLREDPKYYTKLARVMKKH